MFIHKLVFIHFILFCFLFYILIIDSYNAEQLKAYEYQGCVAHGHPPGQCPITEKIKNKEWFKKRQPALLERTLRREQFLTDRGVQVTSIWECQFQKEKKENHELKTFCQKRWATCFKSWPNKAKIIDAIQKGNFFGAVEVDIAVPEQWNQSIRERSDFQQKFAPFTPKTYFSEMCPIFLNTEVPITTDIIGEHMMEHVRKNNLSEKPRRLLVAGMRAEKVLLASPLVKWYLDHGLEISRVSNNLLVTRKRTI